MTAEPIAMESRWKDRYVMFGALLVAWVAMVGSLYFSEVAGYTPCQWCWYQRILMYPMALGILPIGLLTRDERLPYYTALFSGLGMLAASYHYLLQKTSLFVGTGGCSAGVPCNAQYINWFDFITIPFLALMAFILIFLASVVAITARQPLWQGEVAERAPWLPVLGLIGIVLVVFAPSFLGAGDTAETDSQTLYEQQCAACHGAQGEGVASVAPALTASALSDTEWVEVVLNGLPADSPLNQSGRAMPAYPQLTDTQALSIRAFLDGAP